ncbi:GntR family transcriptional regulator [Effusibacillus dendaii]|uniref:GntR family transcriptional regulator n=1 Tax=Effusibacillus dendaii TaxID=2743772 RepID=A0A7I8DCK2_9BACL|nr:GntR family transcriptional regulator [Effusibacillus dendaii]BCJ87082.1 GntR family transcriptional regulator [Effusibacillus dendaii]
MKMQIRKYEPMHQQAYEILRNMIIEGILTPGTKLVEEKLAAQMGVSRTPIRESIKRLEQDGLVQENMVIEPSEDDLRDSYEIRMLLEGYSARCAAVSFTEAEKKELQKTVQQAKEGSFEEALKANTVFHDLIVKASGNKRMIDVLEKMRSLILLCRHQIVKSHPCLHDEHDKICEAISSGDADAAEKLMKEHLHHNMEEYMRGLKARSNEH